MKTSISHLASIIANKTKNGNLPNGYAKAIAAYLLDEGRTGDLSSLLRSVQEDWAENGLVEATITSAFNISEKTKRDIEKKIREIYPNAKKIILISEHDPRLIGGVRITTANNQMDITISSKLSKFKQLTTLS